MPAHSRLRLSALAALLVLSTVLAGLAAAPARAATTTLVAIRAAHHPGFDRVVLEFRGPLPPRRTATWVPTVVNDPSGLPTAIAGHAFLQTRFSPAAAHTDAGRPTLTRTVTLALPDATQVVVNGDFEGVLSVAVGLQRRTPVHISTLAAPTRFVLDFATPFPWVNRRVFFQDSHRFATGRLPFTVGVTRPVIPPAVGRQALERLFAGPTPAELAVGLRLVRSGATGVSTLTVAGGVARVRLTGGCASGGSTYTVADEISPTLKQFPTVRWVKIYDPSGHTERPSGPSDSIPTCLEP